MRAPRPRILLTGLTYFCDQLLHSVFTPVGWKTEALPLRASASRYSRLSRLARSLLRADLWYWMGGSVGRGRILGVAQLLRVPVVIHWIGSDVLEARRYFPEHQKHLRHWHRVTHWAGAPWLVDELADIGIEATFMPLPLGTVGAFLEKEMPELPDCLTIATYVPESNPTFYGWGHIRRLADEFPDVEFIVAGGSGRFLETSPPNVRFVGWINDIGDAFGNATVVVRMTEHDGYGGTVQEALALGRYAIWTYPFPSPGAFLASSYPALRKHVSELYDLQKRGLLALNRDGREYMRSNMHPEALAQPIVSGLRRLLLRRRASR